MSRIGIVDLDTSHPGAWIPIIRELGHEVVGVYDSGGIYQKGYKEIFAQNSNVSKIYCSLEEMAEEVDLAIIHSCNWDVHIDRARPFINCNKAVFIDKPMIGNMRDAMILLEWSKKGYKVTGGSSFRYAYEVEKVNKTYKEEFGEILFVFTGQSVDDFNYGIHAFSVLQGIMGAHVESVRHLGTKIQHLVEVTWKDGRKGIVHIGKTNKNFKGQAYIVGTNKTELLKIEGDIYRALLENVLPYLCGEKEEPPVPMDELLEVEFMALAAKKSWENNGTRVFLTDLRLNDPGYDGYIFERSYRLAKSSNALVRSEI